MIKFGSAIRSQFQIEDNYINVNHSSFGYTPTCIIDAKLSLMKRQYLNPDKFIRFEIDALQNEARKQAAEFVGAKLEQSFFTQNSSEAFNAIIKHLNLKAGDNVLISNVRYPMVAGTLEYMKKTVGIGGFIIKTGYSTQIRKYDCVQLQAILKNNDIKVTVFDNISSLPAVIFPVKEIAALCRKYNSISVVDGAHGAGIMKINLEDSNPDFFFTNFNKWCFAPCTVTLLWMQSKYLEQVHPATISVMYDLGIEKEFGYTGTLDRSSMLCIPEAIAYVKSLGLKDIIQYSSDLAWEGANLIAKIWGTELMLQSRDMQSSMVMILIPHSDLDWVKQCQKQCLYEHNVFIVYIPFDGKIWARVTASVYNELSDYEHAATCFLKVLQSKNTIVEFGHKFRSQFEMEEGYICMNHSSFGFVPKCVVEQKLKLQIQQYQNPDKFIRFLIEPLQNEARRVAAEFLGAQLDQSFVTLNSSETFNCVIKWLELDLQKGDIVLVTNITYPMTGSALQYIKEKQGIEIHSIQFTRQDLQSNESIIKCYESALSSRQIKVAIIDSISSQPSVVFPVKQLVKLCEQYNVISIVDAAHGVGIQEINVSDINPDFFYTNFNKWCFTPLTATLFWMQRKYLNQIHPNTISSEYGKGTEKEFAYTGTLDRTSILCIPAAIEFVKSIGLQRIIKYSYDMAWEGSQIIAKIWNTELLVADRTLQSGMVMVRIPHDDINWVKQCQRKCLDDDKVLFTFTQFDGLIWSRISGSLYNELSDYEYAANCFLRVLQVK